MLSNANISTGQAYVPVKPVVTVVKKSFFLPCIFQTDGACIKPAFLNFIPGVTTGGHCVCKDKSREIIAEMAQVRHGRRRGYC